MNLDKMQWYPWRSQIEFDDSSRCPVQIEKILSTDLSDHINIKVITNMLRRYKLHERDWKLNLRKVSFNYISNILNFFPTNKYNLYNYASFFRYVSIFLWYFTVSIFVESHQVIKMRVLFVILFIFLLAISAITGCRPAGVLVSKFANDEN